MQKQIYIEIYLAHGKANIIQTLYRKLQIQSYEKCDGNRIRNYKNYVRRLKTTSGFFHFFSHTQQKCEQFLLQLLFYYFSAIFFFPFLFFYHYYHLIIIILLLF